MSLHKSLKTKIKFGRRNVLSRVERIKLLKKRGRWEEGNSVLGLPKEKIVKLKKIKVEKKETEEQAISAWNKRSNQ